MDVIRPNTQPPSARATLATLPRLNTSQLSPTWPAQRRQSRLSNLFVGLQRSLSTASASTHSAPSPLQPPWTSKLCKHICSYLDFETLLQVRLVDRAFNVSACAALGARHGAAIETWLPKLMAHDVRMSAAALRRDPKALPKSTLDAPLGQALVAHADRLALKHVELAAWERPRWHGQMLLSAKLMQCSKLTKLHLSCHGPMPSQRMVRFLGELSNLRLLSVAGGDFKGYDLAEAWAGLGQLRVLALSDLRYERMQKLFETFAQLNMLRLAYTPDVSEDVIRRIAAMQRLQTLELIGLDLDDAALAPLRHAKALKHLDISCNRWLTPDALTQLAPKQRSEPLRLEQVIIAGVPIDERSAAAAAAMGQLRRLWAPDSHMTPWGVRIVSQTRHLDIAVLRGQCLTPSGTRDSLGPTRQPPASLAAPLSRRSSFKTKRREILCGVPADGLDDCAFAPLFVRVFTTGWTQDLGAADRAAAWPH